VGLTARKLAIEDAQRQVLSDVLDSMVGEGDKTPFHALLRQSARYISRYDLLLTSVSGQTTEVEIDAHVLERPLRHDVAAIMMPRLPRKPSVAMLIAEYIGPDAAAGGPTFDIGEAVFKERVKELGFSLTGVHELLNQFDIQELLAVANGDIEHAVHFARANKSDVVIIGSATAEHEPIQTDSNMFRNRVTVTLRVFAGADGKMMDTLTAQSVVQSVDPMDGGKQAVQDACGKLASEFVVAVVLTMLSLEDESRVLMDVQQPGTESVLQELAQWIEQAPGTGTVEILHFSESEGRLAVEYVGAMADFSDWISGHRIENRKVEVIRCVKREMTVRFL
jgi:hypothetical protein